MNMHYIGGYTSTPGWTFKATGHRKMRDGKLQVISGSTNRSRGICSLILIGRYAHIYSLWLSAPAVIVHVTRHAQDALLLFIVLIYTYACIMCVNIRDCLV